MEKCSLCGGKIVNHRCVDCGMPYPEKPHYTLRSETAHTHSVNGEEVLHRVRSATGKDPVYTCDAEDEQDRIDLEGARPHLHAPARQLNQTRRPARDKRRGGWLVTLIIFGLALLPMLFNLSERVFYSLADLGGRSSYAETEAPEASIHAEAPAEEGPVMKKIKESGKLVVGTEAQYAPYEFKDLNANFAGCDMWLAQQIADALGVELEVVDMSFDGIIPAVQSSQVDIGIAAFTVTEERAQVIDFSEVYEKSPQAVIVKKGNEATYSTKESFAGQKVGAQKGTVQSLLIKNVLTGSELFELDKYPELGMEVAAGNIAALVVDSAVADALIKSNPELALAAFEFDPNEVNYGKAAVIAKGNEDFVAAVNEVITKVASDGSFQKAYDEAVALADSMGLEMD